MRGIGRYMRALALEMLRQRGSRDLGFAFSANFPEAREELVAELRAIDPQARFLSYATPASSRYGAPQADPARRLGEAAMRRAVALDAPDVWFASSLFEAWPDDFALSDFARLPSRVGAAIAYDFIPALFPDLYLRDRHVRRFQEEQMKASASADLLLAISDSTRADAIRLLNVAPGRVVNISGAADAFFAPVADSPAAQARLRELGIERDFVFCASGDDPRKNVDAAIEAICLLPQEARAGRQFALLVPFETERRTNVLRRFAAAGLGANGIVLLDRIDDSDLALLYARCALFLFPSLYEGFGLPVLEAMQCGAPVVVGDNSSLVEIVDRADLRCDTKSPQAIAQRMTLLLREPAFAEETRRWALARAKEFSWGQTARRAWDALDEADARIEAPPRARSMPGSLLLPEGYEAEAAAILKDSSAKSLTPQAAADLILKAAPQFYDGSRRRLLVDVTTIVAKDDRTGIQRVVRSVAAALYRERDLGAVTPVAVRLQDGRVVSCESWIARETGVPQSVPDAALDIAQGDCLLMLDNSWGDFARFTDIFADVRAAGGIVVSCIYDLIPQIWRGASVGRVPEIHLGWLKAALMESDGMIAISRTVAEELCDYVAAQGLPVRAGLRIGWFHCGSDVPPAGAGQATERMRAALAGAAPVFVLVGTFEPRKGHAIALAAFERLWAAGVDARLVFVGRRGWHVDTIVARMQRNPEFERRLFWFADVDDSDLAFAYDNCAAVLAPAYAEGFGLPLVEAARKGKTVICSDIPVFREVGGDGAVYFPVNDPDAMADAIRAFLDGRAKADPARVIQPTWRDAALRIVDVVMRDEWMRRLS